MLKNVQFGNKLLLLQHVMGSTYDVIQPNGFTTRKLGIASCGLSKGAVVFLQKTLYMYAIPAHFHDQFLTIFFTW